MSSEIDRFSGLLSRLYVVALGIPLFLLPFYQTTNLTRIFRPAAPASRDLLTIQIHWVVVISGLVVANLLFRLARSGRLPAPPPPSRLVAALFLAFLVALAAGLVTDPSWLKVVYFVQTTIPLVGFAIGLQVAASTREIRRSALFLVGSTTIAILMILGLAAAWGGFSPDIEAANRLARAIPQFRSYFPFIVATSLSLAIASLLSSRRRGQRVLLLLAILIHLLFYSLVWARMGLVMLAVVVLAPILLGHRSRKGANAVLYAVTATILLAAALLLASQVSVLKQRLDGEDLSGSDSRRIQYALEAGRMVLDNPLFGRMFAADWARDTHPRRELEVPRVYKAHNQYLDYGVRAGVVPMILLAWIAVVLALRLRRVLIASRVPRDLHCLTVGISGALLAVFLGNLTQLFLVQAQTGSLAWLLAGIAARLPELLADPAESPR